jgi:hypothetical protein
VAFLSRYLGKQERRWTALERTISLVGWGLRKLRRYTTYAKKIRVLVPQQEHVLVILEKQQHVRLRALLIEMGMYQVEWEAGENPWALGGAAFKSSIDPGTAGEPQEVPVMKHKDKVLKRPAQISFEPLEATPDDVFII